MQDGTVGLVNTGVEQIYNKSLAAGHFKYILLQAYNTGHYCLGPNSASDKYDVKFCNGASVDNINQFNIYFVPAIFNYVINHINTGNAIINVGQPSNKAGAGLAQIFNGPYNNIYNKICEVYNEPTLKSHPRMGGAMTWSANIDRAYGDKFIHSLLSNDCSNT